VRRAALPRAVLVLLGSASLVVVIFIGLKVSQVLARPMFCRWKPHERGAHWQEDYIAAANNIDIYVDQPLNMVVLARVGGIRAESWSQRLRPGYAILFGGTPLETQLYPEHNVLVIIESDGSLRRFRLDPGFGEKMFSDLAYLIRHGVFEYLGATYSGPDRQAFDEYLRAVRSDAPP
jgi:hypothetical protein